MDEELLDLFREFYEKQDIVQKQTTKPFIHEYGHSELHCIDTIGRYERTNVTSIGQRLSITRGAASKIARRLIERGDVEKYQVETNRKEVYYSLTERGQRVFDAHTERHAAWQSRDLAFLETVPEREKRAVSRFLKHFNRYLQQKIENDGGKEDGAV